MDINWEELKDLAISAMEQAYCPYSGFPVGAAGLTTDGHTYSGCNVENAGYGVTLCAECGMVSQMVRSGGGRLAAVVAVNGNCEPVAPFGRALISKTRRGNERAGHIGTASTKGYHFSVFIYPVETGNNRIFHRRKDRLCKRFAIYCSPK